MADTQLDRIEKLLTLIATHTVPGFGVTEEKFMTGEKKGEPPPTAHVVKAVDFEASMREWDKAHPIPQPGEREAEVNRLLGFKGDNI